MERRLRGLWLLILACELTQHRTSQQATIPNHKPKKERPTGTTPRYVDEEAACSKDWECVPLAQCARLSETLFPCGGEEDALHVCCPSIIITLPTSTATHQAPTWLGLPPSLHERAQRLLPDKCGPATLNHRIINGHDADIGDFPWMALLGYKVNGETKFWCGGSLINNRYVLTAAHCSKVQNIVPSIVRLGEWNVTSEEDCTEVDNCADPVVDVGVEQMIVHHGFGNKSLPSLRHDISLVRLDRIIGFTDFIMPICLPPPQPPDDENYIVSGWGVSNSGSVLGSEVLQFVTVSHYDWNECNSVAPREVRPLSRMQLCAGGQKGQDACRGDSGGPLTYNKATKEVQRGIVSFATSSCAREGRPTVYTDVSAYMDWILANMMP